MKIQSPWMGRVRGSAGNMTGCKVYNKNVLRAKAFEVSNPNTAAQQTERSFFAQVADCCASVSEAQLRSLFGMKPKSMSRRNALTKQVSKAYSIDGTSKTLDLSKLLAIGNGEKVYTPLGEIANYEVDFVQELTLEMFGSNVSPQQNIIIVMFDTDNNKIDIAIPGDTLEDYEGLRIIDLEGKAPKNGFCYCTTTTNKNADISKGFGSFVIKTRADK